MRAGEHAAREHQCRNKRGKFRSMSRKIAFLIWTIIVWSVAEARASERAEQIFVDANYAQVRFDCIDPLDGSRVVLAFCVGESGTIAVTHLGVDAFFDRDSAVSRSADRLLFYTLREPWGAAILGEHDNLLLRMTVILPDGTQIERQVRNGSSVSVEQRR